MSLQGKEKRESFSIQWKLAILFLVVSTFVVVIAASGILGLKQINTVSSRITEKEVPLLVSMQEALTAMVSGQSAIEQALDIEDVELKDKIFQLESLFGDSVTQFRMYMSAITWGSESDAFKNADGGSVYKAWVEEGLDEKFQVKEASEVEIQIAGETNIYFDGFTTYALEALQRHKEYLTLKGTEDIEGTQRAQQASREAMSKARYYGDLVSKDLNRITQLSNISTEESVILLTQTGNRVETSAVAIALVCIVLISFGSIIFARKVIIKPLRKLSNFATDLGAGKLDTRIDIRTNDEMGTLSNAFNVMAENLKVHTDDLEKEVENRTQELGNKVKELDASNQLLVRREEELTIVNDRLRELDKAKSEFISVAAHQLRTPLSAIKWTLSLIVDDEDADNLTAAQRSLIMKGYESNERIIRLVNEMLVVTRIESGKVQYSIAPFHIEDLIESVLLDFTGAAQEHAMHLSFDRQAVPLPYAKADAEKIRGVLQNLIENSMRYTRDGGTIIIQAAQESDMIKVTIKDTGIGIPMKQQSGIFNKFFRADNATKAQTDGSGLGLFVAKSMIEKHGGTIWFESVEGSGTTFYFTLPCETTAV